MSARRRRPVYTDEAQEDLRDALHFTEQKWGREQRSAYQRLLRQTVRTLTGSPLIGRSQDGISPGLRSHLAASHVIYYWVIDEVVTVARILHSSRDASRFSWTMPIDDIDTAKSQ